MHLKNLQTHKNVSTNDSFFKILVLSLALVLS